MKELVIELPDEDLRDAIQAAWLADRVLAAVLARQHELFNVICLRCAADWISSTTPPGRSYWIYQLCNSCVWTVSRGAEG